MFDDRVLIEPITGLLLDLSQSPAVADSPAMKAALEAMAALEAGAIANPDEGRQVGHYWLRSPALAPPEAGAAVVDSWARAGGRRSGRRRPRCLPPRRRFAACVDGFDGPSALHRTDRPRGVHGRCRRQGRGRDAFGLRVEQNPAGQLFACTRFFRVEPRVC